jgi:hypothetical protein
MLTIVNDNHICQGILSGVIAADKKKLPADGFRRGGRGGRVSVDGSIADLTRLEVVGSK